MLGGLGDIFVMPASQSYITISFQLGGGSTGGDMLGGLGDIFGIPASQSYIIISFQLGGGSTGGDMLGGLGDIFGMPASQSYIPPQEVSLPCFLTRYFYLQTFQSYSVITRVEITFF